MNQTPQTNKQQKEKHGRTTTHQQQLKTTDLQSKAPVLAKCDLNLSLRSLLTPMS